MVTSVENPISKFEEIVDNDEAIKIDEVESLSESCDEHCDNEDRLRGMTGEDAAENIDTIGDVGAVTKTVSRESFPRSMTEPCRLPSSCSVVLDLDLDRVVSVVCAWLICSC